MSKKEILLYGSATVLAILALYIPIFKVIISIIGLGMLVWFAYILIKAFYEI